MLTDLRGHYCVGLGMLGFGLWGVIGRYGEAGSVVVGGAVLIAAAVLANSIKSDREAGEEAESEQHH